MLPRPLLWITRGRCSLLIVCFPIFFAALIGNAVPVSARAHIWTGLAGSGDSYPPHHETILGNVRLPPEHIIIVYTAIQEATSKERILRWLLNRTPSYFSRRIIGGDFVLLDQARGG